MSWKERGVPEGKLRDANTELGFAQDALPTWKEEAKVILGGYVGGVALASLAIVAVATHDSIPPQAVEYLRNFYCLAPVLLGPGIVGGYAADRLVIQPKIRRFEEALGRADFAERRLAAGDEITEARIESRRGVHEKQLRKLAEDEVGREEGEEHGKKVDERLEQLRRGNPFDYDGK
jgi:hypothetical protein